MKRAAFLVFLLLLLGQPALAQHEITVCNDPISSNAVMALSVYGGSSTCDNIGSVSELNPAQLSDFCFSSGTYYNNSFQVETKYPYLLRRIMVDTVGNSTTSPSGFPDFIRLSGSIGGGPIVWFTTPLDQDEGSAWSNVEIQGDIFNLNGGLPFSSLSVWPSTNAQTSMRFAASLYGCALADTGNVTYVFESSSQQAIVTTFSGKSFFESALSKIIQGTTKIDPSRYLVTASPQENGNVSVTLRVLPDSASDAKSVEALVTELSTNAQLIRALNDVQAKITDHSASMCTGKICSSGQVCILGKCATRDAGFISNASSVPRNPSGMLRLLATAPLINSSSESAPLGERRLISIILGGAFLLALLAIGLQRAYKRMSTRGELD